MTADTPPQEEKKPRRKRPLPPAERQARAALILGEKLRGKRTEEICNEFRLSRATVYRALSDAKMLGLLHQARDWMSLNLIPLSLAAIEDGLIMGDIPTKVDTAFRVLESLGLGGKHTTLHIDTGDKEATFEEYRAQVIRRTIRPGLPVDEAEVVEALPPSGPAGVSESVPEGSLPLPSSQGAETGSAGNGQGGI